MLTLLVTASRPAITQHSTCKHNMMFDGNPTTLRKIGTPTPTQFLAHVYCGQTAGWMKTPLGTEVDLGLSHIVLDGVPALHERGTAVPPLFSPCLLWPRSPISATAELLFYRATQRDRCMYLQKLLTEMQSACKDDVTVHTNRLDAWWWAIYM